MLLKGVDADALLRMIPVSEWAAPAERIVVHVATAPDAIYDAVLQLWSATPLIGDAAGDPLLERSTTKAIRLVREVIGKSTPGHPPVGTTPGLAQLSFIRARPELWLSEVERHWAEHVPLACKVHVGMIRYVQDHILPGGVGECPWFGMAHLHFPDAVALRDGLFRSDADVAAITADVAEFVADHATMVAIAHVLRG